MTEASSPSIGARQATADVQSFLIADVRGYTRYTQEHGDEAAAKLVAEFEAVTREVVEAGGGRIAGVWGDEVLAVFGSARQALRSAVELQMRFAQGQAADLTTPLPVGIGVDVGEAVVVEGAYRGAALNLAGRLCGLAGPGEVLASEGILHLARKMEGLAYSERGLVNLKGFAEPVRVIEIVPEARAPVDGHNGAHANAAQRRSARLPIGNFLGALPAGPLVSRNDELSRIFAAVDAAEGGVGQFVVLTGEAGVGKTRLAQEVTLKVRNRGFLVATGRCYEPQRSVPYYPFLEALATAYSGAPAPIRADVARRWPLLGRLLPEDSISPSGSIPDGPEEQQRLFRAVTGFILALAEHMPVALLFDDLHWADEASILLLQHLVRQTRSDRVLLVGIYQNATLSRDHGLEVALRDLGRERLVERVPVQRLSREGTAEMLAAILGDLEPTEEFTEFVHRRTRGTPVFIDDMLRSLGGRYRLVRELGAGGMGRVFRAVDSRTGKAVAAKIMLAKGDVELDALLRFQQEGALLSTLKHPNIVEVHGTFLEEHASCIIMELLEGQSLRQLLHREPLGLPRIRHIFLQVTAALEYAHGRRIVHRDIKPDNIMVLENDVVKVTDFGVAQILRPGTTLNSISSMGIAVGTPLYMSPEQIEGRRLDGRADIYSLGAVLYQVVTGRPPFEGHDPVSIALKHVNEAPQPPRSIQAQIPEDWEALILKMLAKDPADRFQTATALREAMVALTPHEERELLLAQLSDSMSTAVYEPRSGDTSTHASTFWERGRARERTGDLAGALDAYRNGLALAPPSELRNDLVVSNARVLREHGRAKERAGHLEAALDEYRAALALAPSGEMRDDLRDTIARLTSRMRWKKTVSELKSRQEVAFSTVALAIAVLVWGIFQFRPIGGSSPASGSATAAAHREATAIAQKKSMAAAHRKATVGARARVEAVSNVLRRTGQVLGPTTGSLTAHQVHVWASQNVRDFIARVRFDNPANRVRGGWGYGLWFRNFPMGGQYRLMLGSDKQYRLTMHNMMGDTMTVKTVARGNVPTLNVAPNGSNDVTLLVDGAVAMFAVNGRIVTSLNVANKLASGDVGVAAGPPWDVTNSHYAHALGYENFTVWSLQRGVYGPKSGNLSRSGPSYAGLGLKDFVARLRFDNPAGPRGIPWDYGLWFRNAANTGQYRLAIDSNKRYTLRLHEVSGDQMQMREIAHGTVPSFNASRRGSNVVTLFVVGPTGLLTVNGRVVASLDVSADVISGDVGASTGPLSDTTTYSKPLRFEDFIVWPVVNSGIPGGVAPTSTARNGHRTAPTPIPPARHPRRMAP